MADMWTERATADGVAIEYFDGWARFRGTAEQLIEAGVILPEWIPPGRKRASDSETMPGTLWGTWHDWDEERCRDWKAVRNWRLQKRAGGVLEFTVFATWMHAFPRGPAIPGAGREAAQRHCALIRARTDARFRAFLGRAGLG